jgi:prevent-host-death family protein
MNVITSTTLRNNLSDTLKEVGQKREYLLVSKKGKVSSALVNIDLFEDLLALANKNYVKKIKAAREEYKKGHIVSHDEAFGEL